MMLSKTLLLVALAGVVKVRLSQVVNVAYSKIAAILTVLTKHPRPRSTLAILILLITVNALMLGACHSRSFLRFFLLLPTQLRL